ncbi:peptide-methionine (S)-S-oxide reductase MsrA [Pedobacter sp. SYP-B3415]|uniref:peptide-methionine (S)-S-oxide reductase MsrA n=1 Tax=Pedobacter sp. SYP-B3415 TaxID=2496641 RepID=UPI00101D8D46|nr:peptide-methionine (S)-S-oxide reductase MsrA [Pedobacter sp. SYP-B3415]
MQTATFGGGCFWCTEAIFQTLSGVEKVTSGYSGGETRHPTYMEISNGDTGHAEVIQIEFDEEKISYPELLLIFFRTHNPTTRNRQGNDIGSQYRSVIFWHSETQRRQAEEIIRELTDGKIFDGEIITELAAAGDFYPAEGYHQNYFMQNMYKPYCSFVIQPKLNKFAEEFRDKIRPELFE